MTDTAENLRAEVERWKNLCERLQAQADEMRSGRPVVPALWSRSLGSCWPDDDSDPLGDWSIGTVDVDGIRYEVVRVEASQYDAEGESQKIAEAIVRLWNSAEADTQSPTTSGVSHD